MTDAEFHGDILQMQALLGRTGGAGGGSGRLGYELFEDGYYPGGTLRSPDVIRLLPASYSQTLLLNDRLITAEWPFFTWREHRDTRSFKSAICSAGPMFFDPDKRNPCHGCNTYYNLRTKDERNKWKEGWLTSRLQHSLSIIHFREYQLLPVVDKTTKQIRVKRDGSPFMEWQRGVGDKEADTVSCRKMRWDFGITHRSILLDLGKALFYSCSNCGSKDSIYWEAIVCGNPECEAPIYEREEGSLSEAEIKELEEKANDLFCCPHCEKVALPVKYYACHNCESPRPATIFDVPIKLATVESMSPGAKKVTKSLQIAGWGDPGPLALPEGLSEEEIEYLTTPFDLEKILAPTPSALQVAIIGAGAASSGRTPSSKEYGK